MNDYSKQALGPWTSGELGAPGIRQMLTLSSERPLSEIRIASVCERRRSRCPRGFTRANLSRKSFVHEQKTERIGAGVDQPLESFDLTEYLENSCQVLKGAARIAAFKSPNRTLTYAASLCKSSLGEPPAAPGKGDVPGQLLQSPGDRKRKWQNAHKRPYMAD